MNREEVEAQLYLNMKDVLYEYKQNLFKPGSAEEALEELFDLITSYTKTIRGLPAREPGDGNPLQLRAQEKNRNPKDLG